MIRKKKSNEVEGEHGELDGDSTSTSSSPPPPQMSTREIVKLSFLLGLVDSSGDFDEYFLYLLLPLGYGCEDVNLIFSLLLLSKNICTWFNKPICGLLLDSSWASRRQHSTLLISSSFFFFTALFLMYFGDSSSKPILVILFLAHEFSTALLETNVWKVIKLRTQLIYGKKNVELQEQIISRIGINNAMISDCLEMIALIVTYWICHSARSYLGATLFLGSVIVFSDFFILIISLTYNHSNMYSSSSSSSSSPAFTPLPSSPGRAIEMTKRNTLVMKRKEGELEEEEEELERELEEDGEGEFKTQKELDKRWYTHLSCRSLKASLMTLKRKLLYLWNTKLAIHALSQSLLLYAFTGIAEYPLSFSLSDQADDEAGPSSSTDPPTLQNFCHNKVSVLVLLAVIDNAVYAAGSFIYSFFFVKMQPITWFSFAYPVITSAVLGVLVSLWYVHDVVKMLAYTLTSILIVVPYYCEKYNFYFASACIDEKYFGFTYSVLGLAKNGVSFAISLVFLKAEDHLQDIFSLLLLVCGLLLLLSILYSSFLYFLYIRITPKHHHHQIHR